MKLEELGLVFMVVIVVSFVSTAESSTASCRNVIRDTPHQGFDGRRENLKTQLAPLVRMYISVTRNGVGSLDRDVKLLAFEGRYKEAELAYKQIGLTTAEFESDFQNVHQTLSQTVGQEINAQTGLEKEHDKVIQHQREIMIFPLTGRTPQVAEAIAKTLEKAIEDVTDDDLTKLVRLDLRFMNIRELKENDFHGLTSLSLMHLDDNQLTTVPEGLFHGLPSLREVHLRNNQLTALPEGLFQGSPSLQWVSLSGNKLTKLPEGLLHGLTSLEMVHLETNKLTTVPEGLLNGLNSLRVVSLANNQLTTLPDRLFDGLASQKVIYLYDNQLTQVEKARLKVLLGTKVML